MFRLVDTFNNCLISRHRTIKACVIADHKHNRAVKAANGQNSYIPTAIRREDGEPLTGDQMAEIESAERNIHSQF